MNWEKGVDRIADLKILPEVKIKDSLLPKNIEIVKCVQLNDTWEKYELNLTVFHPVMDQNELLRVQCTANGLGNWDRSRFDPQQNMSARSSFDLLHADINSEAEAKAHDDEKSIKLAQSTENIEWF